MKKKVLYITEEDLKMLCEECQKDTVTGKLASISLIKVLKSFEDESQIILDITENYSEAIKAWRLFKWLSLILAICFCPKFGMHHFMFWVNLALPFIGHFLQNYCRAVVRFCIDKHHELLERVVFISEALHKANEKYNEEE